LLPVAHDTAGLDGLSVGEGVAVFVEMVGQVVGRLAGLRADDEPEPGLLQRQEVGGRQQSGVGDHDDVGGLGVLVAKLG
jgi:hypothetical protein